MAASGLRETKESQAAIPQSTDKIDILFAGYGFFCPIQSTRSFGKRRGIV